jgi:Ricin-type beta-trefoil lectin domain
VRSRLRNRPRGRSRRSLLASLLSTLAVLTGLVLVPAAPANALVVGGIGTIQSVHTLKCMETDPNHNTIYGRRVQMWDCNGAPWQQWEIFQYPGQPGHTLVNVHTRTCLDIDPGQNHNGAAVYLWHCNRTTQQNWKPYGPNPFYQISSHLPTWRCLDAWDNYNGAPVRIWDCSGQSQQKWF